MVGRTIANLSLSEFDKLRDFQLRDAGNDITRTHFAVLKEALHKEEGKLNIKYLTKQNRRSGQNHKWSEDEIEKIQKVVEEAQLHWPQ